MRELSRVESESRAHIGSVRALRDQFKRSLLAENKSKSTIEVYTSAVDRFADYLDANGMPSAAPTPGVAAVWLPAVNAALRHYSIVKGRVALRWTVCSIDARR